MLSLLAEAAPRFGREPLKAAHNLHDLPLFDDASLVELLDRMPRENLFALAMGHDPTCADDRRPASHEGVSGTQLLEAVERGRLWLNVTRVDTYEPRYSALLDQLFGELVRKVPGLQVDGRRATLLISSPAAQVYYHADGAPTVLWHLRGRKRIYIYPANDERFLSRQHLEDIFAGVRTEYVPYRPEFDSHAVTFDLEPGDLAAWPQNAPHRVVNLAGLNVSLSSEYFTPESRRRARLFTANRFLRTTLRLERFSTSESMLFAAPKIAAHRLGQALGLDQRNTRRHVPVVRVDPLAPSAVSPILAPPAPVSVRCLTQLDELRPFREALDALNGQSRAPDAFATFAFYQSYLAHHPQTEMRFLTAWEGDRPLGHLALRRTCERFWGTQHPKLEFLAARDVDAPRMVCRPEDEARCAQGFYRYLLARDQDWSMVELRQQYPDSPMLRIPAGVDSRGHRLRLFASKENATIPVSRFSSLAAFHRACSKKHRNNMSRSVRQLLDAGRVQHVSSDDPSATPALLDLYATIEGRSWKREERSAFFRGLLAPAQPLRISIELILLDDVPIAGLINGAFGRTLYALQIVHDEAFAELSPGTAALMLGVRRAIEGGFANYNLLSGFAYYKTRWLAELRPSQSVQIFRLRSAHDFKAHLGELRRGIVAAPPSHKFNVTKREIPSAPGRAVNPAERARIASLLGTIPRDRSVWLDADDLRRIMPFETRDGLVRPGA
jgi:CelD/BcsL family acetyltransferase involved in cellulose biosynthesis